MRPSGMADPLVLAQSRTVPFPVEQAFGFTLAEPLPRLFNRWWGPLPPIAGVDGPPTWSEAGQVRTIHTADGASMREELLAVEAPDRFGYELTELTGAFKFLVDVDRRHVELRPGRYRHPRHVAVDDPPGGRSGRGRPAGAGAVLEGLRPAGPRPARRPHGRLH